MHWQLLKPIETRRRIESCIIPSVIQFQCLIARTCPRTGFSVESCQILFPRDKARKNEPERVEQFQKTLVHGAAPPKTA